MSRMNRPACCFVMLFGLSAAAHAAEPAVPPTRPAAGAVAAPVEMLPTAVPVPHAVRRDQGYRGIWWGNPVPPPIMAQQLSGGLACEPTDHTPIAQYVAAADKTFFVYAGTSGEPLDDNGRQPLRMMVGCFDHKTRQVSKPVILVDDLPAAGHGCPALTVDGDGRLWVFVSILNAAYPSAIFRSSKPHEIDAWEMVARMEFESPQPWYVPGQGFMLVHVRRIDEKPRLCYSTSRDGLTWSEPAIVATFGEGQSGISGRYKNKIGIAFSFRPPGEAVDSRTDLYYVETSDLGKTWQVFPRADVTLPLTEPQNTAFVFDHNNWKAYLRDLTFDTRGNPIAFYLMRHGRRHLPAPESRVWTTSRWTGREWETTGAMFADSDNDAGCLEVDKIVWFATVPSRSGPQSNSSGGEIMRWRSEDAGRSWYRWPLTPNTTVNHNWVRRVMDGKPEFSTIWADGNTREFSPSRLYFADRPGNVYALPTVMDGEAAAPELVWKGPEPQTQPAGADTQPASAPNG